MLFHLVGQGAGAGFGIAVAGRQFGLHDQAVAGVADCLDMDRHDIGVVAHRQARGEPAIAGIGQASAQSRRPDVAVFFLIDIHQQIAALTDGAGNLPHRAGRRGHQFRFGMPAGAGLNREPMANRVFGRIVQDAGDAFEPVKDMKDQFPVGQMRAGQDNGPRQAAQMFTADDLQPPLLGDALQYGEFRIHAADAAGVFDDAALAFGGIRDAAEALDVAIQSFDPLAPRRDGFAALARAEIAADRGSPCHRQMAQQQGQP